MCRVHQMDRLLSCCHGVVLCSCCFSGEVFFLLCYSDAYRNMVFLGCRSAIWHPGHSVIRQVSLSGSVA